MPTLSLLSACLLFAAPNPSKPTLVVAPLQAQQNSRADAAALTRFVRVFVGQSHDFTLVTPEDMNAIDEELKRQLAGGCEASSCLAEIGGALGARYMITGGLDRLGSRLLVTLKLIDIERVLAVRTLAIKGKDLDSIVDQVPARVSELLGRTPKRRAKNKPAWMRTAGAVALALGGATGALHYYAAPGAQWQQGVALGADALMIGGATLLVWGW